MGAATYVNISRYVNLEISSSSLFPTSYLINSPQLVTLFFTLMSSSMPHATSPRDLQEELDDILIQQALDPESRLDFNRELEPGEKAEDAIDYEDLSDDDLADDESEGPFTKAGGNGMAAASVLEVSGSRALDQELHELANYEANEGDGFDDLFGDNVTSQREDVEEARRSQITTSSPSIGFGIKPDENMSSQGQPRHPPEISPSQARARQDGLVSTRGLSQPATSTAHDKLASKEQQLQQELFAMSGYGSSGVDYLPPPPENQEELLKSLWPKYERTVVPRFMELLPSKKMAYSRKIPLKKPKSFQPTKLNLDLAKDLEKSFKLPIASSRRNGDDLDQIGVISILDVTSPQGTIHDAEDMGLEPESEIMKDITWQDIQILCQEWETLPRKTSHPDSPRKGGGLEEWSPARNHGGSLHEQPDVHVSKVGASRPSSQDYLTAF